VDFVTALTFSIPQYAIWLPSCSSHHNVPFDCSHIYYTTTCHLTAFMFGTPHYAADCPYVHTTICYVTHMLSLHYPTEGARTITTNTWHTKWASSMSRNNYHISCIDLNLISPMCMKLESLPICSKCLTIKSALCQWNRDTYYFLRLPDVKACGTDYYGGSSLTIICVHAPWSQTLECVY